MSTCTTLQNILSSVWVCGICVQYHKANGSEWMRWWKNGRRKNKRAHNIELAFRVLSSLTVCAGMVSNIGSKIVDAPRDYLCELCVCVCLWQWHGWFVTALDTNPIVNAFRCGDDSQNTAISGACRSVLCVLIHIPMKIVRFDPCHVIR